VLLAGPTAGAAHDRCMLSHFARRDRPRVGTDRGELHEPGGSRFVAPQKSAARVNCISSSKNPEASNCVSDTGTAANARRDAGRDNEGVRGLGPSRPPRTADLPTVQRGCRYRHDLSRLAPRELAVPIHRKYRVPGSTSSGCDSPAPTEKLSAAHRNSGAQSTGS